MKKSWLAIAAACTVWAVAAAEMPRSEWQAKVGECAQNPATLKAVIAQLSAADQTAFLAEVNAAIAQMPGSDEQRAAKFLDANTAAVAGATPANRAAVLAEVFATVPPEYLTVVNENFATRLLNRNANPAQPVSDADFKALAVATMAKIAARCATAENSAVRDTFAALMFERASGGSPADLRDALVATLPEGAQEVASTEWMPAAMGEGREKTYDPMLGVSGAGEEPNHETVVVLMSPQIGVAMIADLQAGKSATATDSLSSGAFRGPGLAGSAAGMDMQDDKLNAIPRADVFSPTRLVVDAAGNLVEQKNPYYKGPHRGRYPGQ